MRLKRGDTGIFEKIYRYYRKKLFTFLVTKAGGNKDIAEEVFSDTVHSALQSMTKIKSKDSIQGWLLQIASRRFNDYLRKMYKEKERHTDMEFDGEKSIADTLDDIVVKKEKLVFFKLALDNIKPDYQKLLHLKYIEKKSQKEIAAIFEKKVTAIEGLLFRAREALKKEYRALYS